MFKRNGLPFPLFTQGPFQEYIPVIGTVIPKKTIYLDAVEGGRVEKRLYRSRNLCKKRTKHPNIGQHGYAAGHYESRSGIFSAEQ